MSFLHRSLSEDKTYEDSLCNVVDCLEEWKNSGNCSPNCLSECPLLCNLVKVSALSPPEVIHHEVNLKRIAIIAATSVISSLFLLTLVILCFNVYRRRRRSVTVSRRWSIEEANEPSPTIIYHPIWHIRTIGLNPTVISSIKACKYSKTDGVVEGTDCSVCLSEFEEEETLRLLPKCRHAFHLSCIDTWLRSHTNCPLCRAPIVVKDDDSSEDVEEIRVRVVEEEDGEIDEEVERDLEEEEEERDEFVSKISTRDHDSLQRVRRSMSLNSLSGVRVSVAGRGKEKMKRSNTGSSIVGRSRSVSYNCN